MEDSRTNTTSFLLSIIFISVFIGLFLGYFMSFEEGFKGIKQIEASPETYKVDNKSKTFDFREYLVEEVTMNITWLGEPVNASLQLKNANFTTIAEKTGKKPEFNMTELGIDKGQYYIRVSYKAHFERGGTEYLISWWLFSFEENGDFLTADYQLAPQRYNDHPSIEICTGYPCTQTVS